MRFEIVDSFDKEEEKKSDKDQNLHSIQQQVAYLMVDDEEDIDDLVDDRPEIEDHWWPQNTLQIQADLT
jgi:hypothetical protein